MVDIYPYNQNSFDSLFLFSLHSLCSYQHNFCSYSSELVINSNRKLNHGEWHKIWIDYNEYHVRFMINTDYQMIELRPEEEFGPFEGSMFIGGATA